MKTEKPKVTREDFNKCLAELPGGETVDKPAFLSIKTDLGNMPEESSGWHNLLDAIATAGKYVDLDLSSCTLNGNNFILCGNKTGREKIVSIIFPEMARSKGLNPADGEKAGLRYFTNLRSISGTGIDSVGEYAFFLCSSLVTVEFPAAANIGTSNATRKRNKEFRISLNQRNGR